MQECASVWLTFHRLQEVIFGDASIMICIHHEQHLLQLIGVELHVEEVERAPEVHGAQHRLTQIVHRRGTATRADR